MHSNRQSPGSQPQCRRALQTTRRTFSLRFRTIPYSPFEQLLAENKISEVVAAIDPPAWAKVADVWRVANCTRFSSDKLVEPR
jgi:hypothetical protein